MRRTFIIFLISSILQSCHQEDSMVGIISIPDSGWSSAHVLEYRLKQPPQGSKVDLIYQLQYDPEFPWENIWLTYVLQSPAGDTIMQSTDNLFLFQPGLGKPYGRGCKERLFIDAFFLKRIMLKDTGSYLLRVRQQMRSENLKGIQALGIRMKKSEER